MSARDMSRRDATRLVVQGTAGLLLAPTVARAEKDSVNTSTTMLQRTIPSSGEKLPVIGLGTWQVFDVGPETTARQPLEQVMARFVALGGKMIDSSPMYGRAEQVVGDLATSLKLHQALFLATKVWTTGRDEGMKSMERSFARMQTRKLDLIQVHNLVDAPTHLATLRDWKAQGRVRYIGITHYTASAQNQVAAMLRNEKVDFVQINYSIAEREAADRVLPIAQERGVAVIANRPFGGGNLLARLRGKPLPDWTSEFDCHSWAQFLLKWIAANPTVTCAIPATSKMSHLEDNMQGGIGRLPDEKLRRRMVETVANL